MFKFLAKFIYKKLRTKLFKHISKYFTDDIA